MSEAKKTLYSMGGFIEVTLYDLDDNSAENHFEELKNECLRLENIFSFNDERSELSELNYAREMSVSEDLLFVINKAMDFAKLTGESYASCSYKDVDVELNTRRVKLKNENILIDLGSFAKGYIADKLASFIKKKGIKNALIDARGKNSIFKSRQEIIGVAHPEPARTTYPLRFKNRAIATSEDYNQYYCAYDKCDINGKNEFISVSVIASTLVDADAAATAIFMMGLKKARKFLARFNEFKVLAIDRGLNSHLFNGFGEIISMNALNPSRPNKSNGSNRLNILDMLNPRGVINGA